MKKNILYIFDSMKFVNIFVKGENVVPFEKVEAHFYSGEAETA